MLLFAAPGGCGSSPPPGTQADLATDSPDMAVSSRSYTSTKIPACGQAGFQSQLAVSADGKTVGVVSIANTTMKGTCTLQGRPPMDVPAYDLCFAESSGGGAFATSKVSSERYLSLNGVGLAYSSTGDANVAFTGNGAGVPEAQFRCGASNLILRTGKGGTWAAARTIATGSQSGGLVPDQMANCIQDVCNSGDATGYWPAIAIAPSGLLGLAWRDIHFGRDTDDNSSSDVEYAAGPGFGSLTVDVVRGGGQFTRLAYTAANRPAIVHYNGDRKDATGIWIDWDSGSGWKSARISKARAGEMLGFAIGPGDLFALAYYDQDGARLVYLESSGGTTWSDPVDVDTDGVTGMYPSLTFDPGGQPAIAYYRCRDYDPVNRGCDRERDGLMLARRSGGRWNVESVTARSGFYDGLYPSLGFAEGGKAVIAYQSRAFDPGSNVTTFELDVARED